MTSAATVFAPAKLTVSLHVTGVRADGYHELDAEMVTLSLADELVFDEGAPGADGSAPGLVVDVAPWVRATAVPSGGENLVSRALAAVGRSAKVHLSKRIPPGGGLGGGSADAAAVLRWAGCADPEVAAGLGADVPFCVVGGRARVRGVGEQVTPLPFVPRDYLLLLPPFGIDTAAVYRAFDAGGRGDGGANDLEAAALAVEPRLASWREALGELTGRAPALAGSGSTWFVEGGPEEPGTTADREVRRGNETARLVWARTVPADWDGNPAAV